MEWIPAKEGKVYGTEFLPTYKNVGVHGKSNLWNSPPLHGKFSHSRLPYPSLETLWANFFSTSLPYIFIFLGVCLVVRLSIWLITWLMYIIDNAWDFVNHHISYMPYFTVGPNPIGKTFKNITSTCSDFQIVGPTVELRSLHRPKAWGSRGGDLDSIQ